MLMYQKKAGLPVVFPQVYLQLKPWLGHGETEAPILWPPDAKSRLTGKDPDAGKD